MENRSSQIWTVLIIIAIIAGGAYWLGNSEGKSNPTIDVKTDTIIKATSVQIGTFYDGKEGYSLSIPSGNSSTCVWTYTGGNASIPYSETTYAKSATEKHTIYSYDYYDWKISCVDDFGNQYTGIFPKTK